MWGDATFVGESLSDMTPRRDRGTPPNGAGGPRGLIVAIGILVTLSCAYVSTATQPAQAQPQRFLVQVDMAKTTVITGRTPTAARVRMTEAATLDVKQDLGRESGPNTNVELIGKGRFIGVVITEDPPNPGALTVLLGRFGRCQKRGCDPRNAIMNVVYPFDSGTSLVLAPGDYRLYLITDGAPVRVTLNFDSRYLKGKTVIKPEAPLRMDLGSIRQISPATPTNSYFAAGNSWELASPGLAVSALWLKGSSSAGLNAAYGECSYSEEPPTPEPIAYSPQCQAGPPAMGPAKIKETHEADGYYVQAVRPWLKAGTFGYGFWYASPTPVTSSGSAAAFVSFD